MWITQTFIAQQESLLIQGHRANSCMLVTPLSLQGLSAVPVTAGLLQPQVDVVGLPAGLQGWKIRQKRFEALAQLAETWPLRGISVPAAQHNLISDRERVKGKIGE